MLAYEDMFPPVEPAHLRQIYDANSDPVDAIAADSFDVAETINPLGGVPNAVSICVFIANPENMYENQYPVTDSDRRRWVEKYYHSLIENLRWFPEGFDTRQWKIIVYVCPSSLEELLPRYDIFGELMCNEFVEIRIMKKPTVGHGPGTLWRFLPISDYSLDQLLIFDIDEPWNDSVNKWHWQVAAYGKALTRGHPMPRRDFWLKPETAWFAVEDGSIRNYATILAAKMLVRPEPLGIHDIDKLMASYIWLRQSRIASTNPCSQLHDEEPLTPYNHPVGRKVYGWGNHWHQYGFDERFLKHVIYPYAAKAGALCTYCLPQDVTEDLKSYLVKHQLEDFLADFGYSQRMNPDNVILNNNAVVTETF